MKTKVYYQIEIFKRAEIVYQNIIGQKTYSMWTEPFSPSCRFIGSWNTGDEILFVAEIEKGEQEGMVSRIAENIPNKFISIQHLGMIKAGVKITEGADAEDWQGFENYNLETTENGCLLKVDFHCKAEYKDYFDKTFPIALDKLKEICER